MQFLQQEISPLGMGCWPIGGPMFVGASPVGYANASDEESIRTIHAALAAGISLFDTAAAYGAGHAERLLARALENRPEPLIVTKIGIGIDEHSKQLTGDEVEPDSILPAIDRCLARLGRDRIDLLLLHQNSLPVPQAEAIFEQMEKAIQAGKIGSYGWSTDFSKNVSAFAERPAFVAVEHAMNVLMDAPRIQNVVRDHGLTALIRSPLAMGLLSGKYDAEAVIGPDDIRATTNLKTSYFEHARPNPGFLAKLNAVGELLTTGGRTLVQGAVSWLWAKGDRNLPIPGARTVAQIEGLAGALDFGALPDDTMTEIETLIARPPDDLPERAR